MDIELLIETCEVKNSEFRVNLNFPWTLKSSIEWWKSRKIMQNIHIFMYFDWRTYATKGIKPKFFPWKSNAIFDLSHWDNGLKFQRRCERKREEIKTNFLCWRLKPYILIIYAFINRLMTFHFHFNSRLRAESWEPLILSSVCSLFFPSLQY